MQTELCIKCKTRPIYIKKRKLCKLCYQHAYKDIKKVQVPWPLDVSEIAEDIKEQIKKSSEYKNYIKKRAKKTIKNLCM